MAPKLIEIPLGPFTKPTGPKNYSCDCTDPCDRVPDENCPACKGTGRVTGEYTPCQRVSSEDDRISSDKVYLSCTDGHWAVEHFRKQWYGWSGTHQFDMIERLWEIVEDNNE